MNRTEMNKYNARTKNLFERGLITEETRNARWLTSKSSKYQLANVAERATYATLKRATAKTLGVKTSQLDDATIANSRRRIDYVMGGLRDAGLIDEYMQRYGSLQLVELAIKTPDQFVRQFNVAGHLQDEPLDDASMDERVLENVMNAAFNEKMSHMPHLAKDSNGRFLERVNL